MTSQNPRNSGKPAQDPSLAGADPSEPDDNAPESEAAQPARARRRLGLGLAAEAGPQAARATRQSIIRARRLRRQALDDLHDPASESQASTPRVRRAANAATGKPARAGLAGKPAHAGLAGKPAQARRPAQAVKAADQTQDNRRAAAPVAPQEATREATQEATRARPSTAPRVPPQGAAPEGGRLHLASAPEPTPASAPAPAQALAPTPTPEPAGLPQDQAIAASASLIPVAVSPVPALAEKPAFPPALPRRQAASAERPPATAVDAAHYRVAPPVADARLRPRHYGLIGAFALLVVLPTLSHSWYLWTKAEPQYESLLGFGSRTEEGAQTFDFLGALGGGGQSGSRDMDILYEFVTSQELVAKVDRDLNLKAMWSRPAGDPLNRFSPDGTIEDLVKYWQRMVLVEYDRGTGLMNLKVFAFDPADAQAIATAILRESTDIVNELSQTAQDDVTRYSKQVLDENQQKLAEARMAVLDFQVRNNIVDPSNVVSNQLSAVAMLNQELTNAEVELDLLTGTLPTTDPRIANLKRRIEVINNRITVERAKVGDTANQGVAGFATLMAEFEKLKVERDFAQQAYLSALAGHNQALADAQKKTRYLATYVAPTLAEAATAPNRPMQAGLTALAGFLIWAISALTFYALRDRR